MEILKTAAAPFSDCYEISFPSTIITLILNERKLASLSANVLYQSSGMRLIMYHFVRTGHNCAQDAMDLLNKYNCQANLVFDIRSKLSTIMQVLFME